MTETETKQFLIRFNECRKHANFSGYKETDLMRTYFKKVAESVAAQYPYWEIDKFVNSRVAITPDDFAEMFIRTKRMVLVTESEWVIKNSDLQFWGDFMFFGRRDYFDKEFTNLFRAVTLPFTEGLGNARTYQVYRAYEKTGLTDEHRKLLAGLYFDMDLWRGDSISLYVQGKRPFGNSSIAWDMFELLKREPSWNVENEDMPKEIIEEMWMLFDQLRFAISDALKFPAASEK